MIFFLNKNLGSCIMYTLCTILHKILNILSKGLAVFLNALHMLCCPGSRSACANTSAENSWEGGGQPLMHSWVPVGHTDDTADELITSQFACCFSKSRCPCTFNPFLASYSPSLVPASVFFLEEFFQLFLMSGIIVPISHLHIPSGQLSFHPHKVLHKIALSDKLSISTTLPKTKPLLLQK